MQLWEAGVTFCGQLKQLGRMIKSSCGLHRANSACLLVAIKLHLPRDVQKCQVLGKHCLALCSWKHCVPVRGYEHARSLHSACRLPGRPRFLLMRPALFAQFSVLVVLRPLLPFFRFFSITKLKVSSLISFSSLDLITYQSALLGNRNFLRNFLVVGKLSL